MNETKTSSSSSLLDILWGQCSWVQMLRLSRCTCKAERGVAFRAVFHYWDHSFFLGFLGKKQTEFEERPPPCNPMRQIIVRVCAGVPAGLPAPSSVRFLWRAQLEWAPLNGCDGGSSGLLSWTETRGGSRRPSTTAGVEGWG